MKKVLVGKEMMELMVVMVATVVVVMQLVVTLVVAMELVVGVVMVRLFPFQPVQWWRYITLICHCTTLNV